MNYKLSIIFSIILALIFIYFKNKDKITLAGAWVVFFTLITGLLLGKEYIKVFPETWRPFLTWIFVILAAIQIVLFLGVAFYISEKYKGSAKGNVVPDFHLLFEKNISNLIFWIVIISINILAFIMWGNDRLTQ